MRSCLNHICRRFLNNFYIKENTYQKTNKTEAILEAQQYLKHAYNRFDNVVDPELMEIAILDIKVAEKRYDYLIREIKKQNEGNIKGGA